MSAPCNAAVMLMASIARFNFTQRNFSAQNNYSTFERICFAIVNALDHFFILFAGAFVLSANRLPHSVTAFLKKFKSDRTYYWLVNNVNGVPNANALCA